MTNRLQKPFTVVTKEKNILNKLENIKGRETTKRDKERERDREKREIPYMNMINSIIIIIINHSVLPKGRSFTANSAFSTLPSSQPSFSYLNTVHLS